MVAPVSIRIWDPAKDEEYVLTDHLTGRKFSGRDSDFVVAEIVGPFPWSEKAFELQRLWRRTSSSGFFSVTPWQPGARALRSKIKAEFDGVSEAKGEVYGYLKSPNQIVDLLRIREAAGGSSSGEWRLGGCSEGSDDILSSEVQMGVSFFLAKAASIGFLLALLEMQQSLLFVRRYGEVQSDLSLLLQT